MKPFCFAEDLAKSFLMLALFITTSLRNYVVYELLGLWHCFAALVYELKLACTHNLSSAKACQCASVPRPASLTIQVQLAESGVSLFLVQASPGFSVFTYIRLATSTQPAIYFASSDVLDL